MRGWRSHLRREASSSTFPRSRPRLHYYYMRLSSPLALLLAAFFAFVLPTQSQTPRVLLRFNGYVSDSSGAGVVTTVTPSAGWIPGFQADRAGTAGAALAI